MHLYDLEKNYKILIAISIGISFFNMLISLVKSTTTKATIINHDVIENILVIILFSF